METVTLTLPVWAMYTIMFIAGGFFWEICPFRPRPFLVLTPTGDPIQLEETKDDSEER